MRAVLLLAGLLACVTRVALADGDPIAIVTSDVRFREAIDQALAPAGMTIVAVDELTAPLAVELANASRVIADRERATATVWLIDADHRSTLVAYDREVDRVLVRELPFALPLGEAHAAQAARMARTMLRALRVTPDTDQLPPRAIEAPRVREQVRAWLAEPPTPVPTVRPHPAMLGLALDGGLRIRGPADRRGATATVALAWRPDALGIGLAVRVASSADLVDPEVRGRVSDASLALLAHGTLRVTRRVTVVPAGGLALHRVRLDGEIGGMAFGERALDPALRLGVGTFTEVGRGVGVGVAMWSDWLLQRQVYELGDRVVLRVPFVQLTFGLVVTARIL